MQRVMALFMSYRSAGYGPHGRIWWTCSLPPTCPQSAQVHLSRSNTLLRHSRYSGDEKCLPRSVECPPCQLGCLGPTKCSLSGGRHPAALTPLPIAALCSLDSFRPLRAALMDARAFFRAAGVISRSCAFRAVALAESFALTSGFFATLRWRLVQVTRQELPQKRLP